MSVIVGHDAIRANIGHLPSGQAAGYTTGTDGSNGTIDIRWRDADWHAHPGAVRIDQDFAASDPSADVLDVERGAATFADCPVWAKKAAADFATAMRPGQRTPAIYFSASDVHNVVNALVGGGVKSGVGLWVAEWALDNAQAVADVHNAAGPFPIVAVQYNSGAFFDTNVFSGTWLAKVSQPKPVVHTHKTSAGDTVASLAAARNNRPGDWLVLQDKLGADVKALASGPLPAGLTWRSEH